MFGDGKTSLRGGYGWSYDNAEVSYYETTVFDNPPAVSSYSVSQASLRYPHRRRATGLFTTPARSRPLPLNSKTPYVQQFSLDLQQEIAPTLMFDIGYFGDHGTHLLGARINQPVPGAWLGIVDSAYSLTAGCV